MGGFVEHHGIERVAARRCRDRDAAERQLLRRYRDAVFRGVDIGEGGLFDVIAAILVFFDAGKGDFADGQAFAAGRFDADILQRRGRAVDIDGVSRNRSALYGIGGVELLQQIGAVEGESRTGEREKGGARQHQPRCPGKVHGVIPLVAWWRLEICSYATTDWARFIFADL